MVKAKGYRLKVRGYRLVVIVCALLLAACGDTTWQSSVPTYPVRFSIDTRVGSFVHFQPTSLNDYITLTSDGYRYNDKWIMARGVTDAYGYGGTVVYVSMDGYNAFDMACPYCAARGQCRTCMIDGIYAVCPECGEEYDLGMGTGVPQRGIAREGLRRYTIINADGKLTISQ